MFIILLAHTEGNSWTLWIPARFGFSDGAEIFVFCSGMASAMAFGSVFVKRSWRLGAARVAFRVWQVYWAHISVITATAFLMVLLDRAALTPPDVVWTGWYPVAGLFTDAKSAIAGYLTLTFVPGLFDILPMYIVILMMIPLVMGVHRVGGPSAVFGALGATWLAAQLALWHYGLKGGETHMLGNALSEAGSYFSFMLFPSNPWGEGIWFFNPFGWQIVFFTGFAFGMKWLRPPEPTKLLLRLAIGYVVLSIPFAWFRIYGGSYLPEDWLLRIWIFETRQFLSPLIGKTGVGALRYLHFLCVAWLAWVAVGRGGARLATGWLPPRPVRRPLTIAALALVALVTVPYTYIHEIAALSPELNTWLYATLKSAGLIANPLRIGLLQIAHMIAVILLIWALIGEERRAWITGAGFVRLVPVIRTVGTQSLAVFLTSIVLVRFNAWWLEVMGRDVWTWLLVNSTGMLLLIVTAYSVGWFKSQPWRNPRKPQVNAAGEAGMEHAAPAR